MLPVAIISIISALIFYSIGIWGERLKGELQKNHVIYLWVGLGLDTLGTVLMTIIAGRFTLDQHGLTGLIAIILMFIQAVWATYTLNKKNKAAFIIFHRYNIIIWIIWLVPFFTGMVRGMAH